MGYTQDWAKEYNSCVLAFTGKNKVPVKALEAVLDKSGALVDSLDRLDKADFGNARPSEKEAVIKAFTQEAKKGFAKASKSYGAILDKALTDTDKATYPDAYRSLKALRAHLTWLDSNVKNIYVTASKKVAKADKKAFDKLREETARLRKEDKSDEEIKIETNFIKQQKLLVAFPTAVKSALDRAKLAIQNIKRDPTPKAYGDEMDSGGRNYTQQMSNLIKLINDPKCPKRVKKLLNGLSGYAAELGAFGDGNKRTVPPQYTAPQILNRLEEFSTLLKETKPYAVKMVKFLKWHRVK